MCQRKHGGGEPVDWRGKRKVMQAGGSWTNGILPAVLIWCSHHSAEMDGGEDESTSMLVADEDSGI